MINWNVNHTSAVTKVSVIQRLNHKHPNPGIRKHTNFHKLLHIWNVDAEWQQWPLLAVNVNKWGLHHQLTKRYTKGKWYSSRKMLHTSKSVLFKQWRMYGRLVVHKEI
jgi:hypothetical protein